MERPAVRTAVDHVAVVLRRGLIDEDGQVSNESTREFLQNYMAEFRGLSREFIRCCRATLKPSDQDHRGSGPPGIAIRLNEPARI
jgi:hypothetical protein